jgi:hypothetical protein
LRKLPDLADAEQLSHSRGRHREHLEQSALTEQMAGRTGDLDEQVLLHRLLRVDRDREQAPGELDLLEAAPVAVCECALHALVTGQLGDDRAPAAAGRDEPERDRDRGLADAALARDEDQASV